MDEHVLRGMARWPDVPAVYGWLALDGRGNWLLKGEPVTNPTVTAYFARNYERDAEGRWFFQNGPQRVYVELAYTPLVYRVAATAPAPLAIESHTGQRVSRVSGAWVDENGALVVETEHGPGVLDDRDLDAVSAFLVDVNGGALPEDALEQALEALAAGKDAPVWLKAGDSNIKLQPVRAADVPGRFGYTRSPAPSPGPEPVASAR
jgi:hypothetical protein